MKPLSFLQKHTRVMFFLFLGESCFAGALVERKAKIYEIGKTAGSPLFYQTTHFEVDQAGVTISDTHIVDAKGVKTIDEKAKFTGSKLISLKLESYQTNQVYEIEVKNDRVFFREGTLPFRDGDKMRESSEGFWDDFSVGPTLEAFLALHFDELLQGKTVLSRLGVMERRETIRFGFKMKVRKKDPIKEGGKNILIIEMKPSNSLLALLVDPIEIQIDLLKKRYERYIGRTTLFHEVKGKLKPLDAEILFEERWAP